MNTGLAPRSTNAFTVDTKVKDGTMTSSPGLMSSNSADISSACVHDVVNSADETGKRFSSHSRQRLVKGPPPERCRCRMASVTYSSSRPMIAVRENGIRVVFCSIGVMVYLMRSKSESVESMRTARCRGKSARPKSCGLL